MKYYIFIDESGSLNNLGEGYFSVSAILLDEAKLSTFKNWVKRRFLKIRKRYDISGEMKAHHFRSANKIVNVYAFVEEVKQVTDYRCFYINNKEATQINLEDKNGTTNYIIKRIVESFVTDNEINIDDELEIICDRRSQSLKYFWSIEKYLSHEFVDHGYIKNLSFKYRDSKKSWEVQVADWVSFANYRILKTPLGSRTQFVKLS